MRGAGLFRLRANAPANKPSGSIGIEYRFPLANVGVRCTEGEEVLPAVDGVAQPAVETVVGVSQPTVAGPSSETALNNPDAEFGVDAPNPVGVGMLAKLL